MSRALTERTAALAAPLLLAAPVRGEDAPAVSEARMRADVEKLVSFGTRHTLSSQDDPKRGIGAARRWAEVELRKTSKACGSCFEIVLPETVVSGERMPVPTRLVDVVAIQRGTERSNEVVIIQDHIDSRASDPLDATSDAPGANDDGSGTALVLEAAVQTFTLVSWTASPGAVGYKVWRRRTDARDWSEPVTVDGAEITSLRLEGVRGDDWLFGVSALVADGSESPVASGVPGGEFAPLTK